MRERDTDGVDDRSEAVAFTSEAERQTRRRSKRAKKAIEDDESKAKAIVVTGKE